MTPEDYNGKFVKVKRRFSMYKTYDDYLEDSRARSYIEKDEVFLLKISYSDNDNEWPIKVELISSDMHRLYNGCKDIWLENTFEIID